MPAINCTMAIFILSCAGLAAGLFWLLGQIRFSDCGLPITADWIEELSIERYRPMLRLLYGDDLAFVSGEVGLRKSQKAQFRSQRVRIFRGYLRCLRSDFEQISMATRVVMVQSRYDRPDLAHALIRRRVQFATGLAIIHLRLFLYQWGLGGVDATGLMRIFEALRLELRALLPGTLRAAAQS